MLPPFGTPTFKRSFLLLVRFSKVKFESRNLPFLAFCLRLCRCKECSVPRMFHFLWRELLLSLAEQNQMCSRKEYFSNVQSQIWAKCCYFFFIRYWNTFLSIWSITTVRNPAVSRMVRIATSRNAQGLDLTQKLDWFNCQPSLFWGKNLQFLLTLKAYELNLWTTGTVC